MRKGMSFSLDDELDKDILDFLDGLKNKSAYIADVIRADIRKKGSFTDEQKDELKDLMIEFIREDAQKDFIRDIIKEFVKQGNDLAIDGEAPVKYDEDATDALDQFGG